jgi:hypothetical protein
MTRSNNSKTTLTLVFLTFAAAWSGRALAQPPMAKAKTPGTLAPSKVLVPKTGQSPAVEASPSKAAMPPPVSAQRRAALVTQVAAAKADAAKTGPQTPAPATTPAPAPVAFEIRTDAMATVPGAPEQTQAPFAWLFAPRAVSYWGAEFRSSTEVNPALFIDFIPQGAYIVDCAVPEGTLGNAGTPFTVTSMSGAAVAVDTITPTNGRLFFATIVTAPKGRIMIERTLGWNFISCKFDPV